MNILGLSSRYNDIVADGNERLSDDPLKIGTKTNNDLSFIVNNQEQLKITSSGANIQIDEIQGGTDGKIEICGAELEGCGTIEGEWVQIPNPNVSTEILPDGKPRVNFSAPIADFVMLDNSFTSADEINISFRVEKTVSGQFDEVGIGYYGNTPPLIFNDLKTAFLEYFGVRAQTPFTDQSNTGTGTTILNPQRLQPSVGGWNWVDPGVYRVRFTLLDGKASWYVKPPDKREYKVSTCDISDPSFTGNWLPYVYNSSTGNITSNTHISKDTEDVVIDGWDIHETFSHLNELANNESVEQLPKVLKVIDQETNDWKLNRKEYEYTLPERSGRLITVDDVAVNDINTELLTLEVAENTSRISQNESDIKDLQGDVIANSNDITNLQTTKVTRGLEPVGSGVLSLGTADAANVQVIQNSVPALTIDSANITTNRTLTNLVGGDYAFDNAVQTNATNIATNAVEIKAKDADILDIQNSIAELEVGTGETVDLTSLNEAVFVEEPPRAYQKVQWYADYATFNMTFVDNVVTKASSTDKDSITSRTELDFLRYDYDILVNIQQVSGSLVHFGFIENELLIDDYLPNSVGWFQVNFKQNGSEWGDGFSARLCYPTATPGNRQLSLGFSRQDPSYSSTQTFDDLKAGQSILFSIRSGILTEINRRNSPTGAWFKYDFAQFGALSDPKLRVSPLKKYKMYFSDGSANNSSFRAAVTYLETRRVFLESEIEAKQPLRADIRRSQFYDTTRDTLQYILSEKNRVITIDTSVYPIYYDGPTQTNLEILIELDPDSIESDYDVYIKHIGSNNTLTIQSGGLSFDADEKMINPWCTTVFRIMKEGEEGKTNSATARKLYSDYNENSINWSFRSNISSATPAFWLIPFNQEPTSIAHGAWSGRFYMPRRAVLRSFIIFGDTEAYNTFLIGNFRLQIYKEIADVYASSITGTDGSLVKDTFIRGRNAVFTATETNTKMFILNNGFDPDNTNTSTGNTIGIVNLGEAAHIIPAGYSVSVRAGTFGGYDGVGTELKGFMYYQFI